MTSLTPATDLLNGAAHAEARERLHAHIATLPPDQRLSALTQIEMAEHLRAYVAALLDGGAEPVEIAERLALVFLGVASSCGTLEDGEGGQVRLGNIALQYAALAVANGMTADHSEHVGSIKLHNTGRA